MTAAIMTRPAARTTVAATNPKYTHRQLSDVLARMVRESDAPIPAERPGRRTLQELLPGHERHPGFVLHRPVMAGEACAPAPATAGGGMQCDVCQGWFGVLPSPAGMRATVPAPTAWTCSACQNLGR
ncbi:hypothetical protein [Streptomyces chartreusis]|uniref:hypothetical protein n=1 Tax=Streptomyces chartreusis TaxID=1969 RepID=UPI001991A350|nr:hypothetical protein [Streptomyces chartreusis]GGX58715.1 hypothetical protein GCM10010321_89360 [Streptomyces chartreusis]